MAGLAIGRDCDAEFWQTKSPRGRASHDYPGRHRQGECAVGLAGKSGDSAALQLYFFTNLLILVYH